MNLRLNNKIKTHIADMAIRNKFKAEFDAKLANLCKVAEEELRKQYHNEDFDVLPERAKALVPSTKCVFLGRNHIQMNREIKYGVDRGYGLNVAFDTRLSIDFIELSKSVYARTSHSGNASLPDAAEPALKELISFLKECSKARDTLISAMAHYRTVKKMFAELPWTEQFYPEQEKKPTCNIVPVSTIAAANDIMGIK